MSHHTFVRDNVTTLDLAGERLTVASMGCVGVVRDSNGKFVAVSLHGDGGWKLGDNRYDMYRPAAIEAAAEARLMKEDMEAAYGVNDIATSKDSDNVIGITVESPEGNDEVIRIYNAFSVRETANGKFRCYTHTGKKLHALPGLYATMEEADNANAVSMSITSGLVIDPEGAINDLMSALAQPPVADTQNFS